MRPIKDQDDYAGRFILPIIGTGLALFTYFMWTEGMSGDEGVAMLFAFPLGLASAVGSFMALASAGYCWFGPPQN